MRVFTMGILLLVSCMFFSGCATLHGSWEYASSLNTSVSYEKFIKEYPDSDFAAEARKRIADPDYAFLVTCKIGTEKAIEGYLISFPSSDYASMARSYLEFLKETTSANTKAYKQFIDRYPNSPFISEAKIATPLLWLKETGKNAGVIVNIKGLIFKGILGGGYGDKEKARQKVYQRFKVELEQEGVNSVLLNDLESAKTAEGGVGFVIIVDYTESAMPKSPPPLSGPYNSSLANSLAWSAADSLASVIWSPAQEVVSIKLVGVSNGIEYYSGFLSLSSSSRGNINRAEALAAIGKSLTPADAIVDLKGKNLSTAEVPAGADTLIKQLKRTEQNNSAIS